tara:strand:- start:80 stop:421 length:342 start_codon:yes stop_codon:yes gene_type:complete
MKPESEYAKDIYSLIVGFIDGPKTVNELETYYLKNKTAINSMRKNSEELYQKLVGKFKEQKDAINSDRLRQGHTDKVAGGEGQRITKEEADRRRKERIAELSKTHPSAGFWKK